MLRRRREMKRLVRVARMLRELDAATAHARSARRRVDRIAVGRV
jgi:hypothetical protein